MPSPAPAPFRWQRLAKLALGTVLGFYLVLLLLLFLFQERLMFPGAYRAVPDAPIAFNTRLYPGWERLERREASGAVSVAWYWPAPEGAAPHTLAVLLHGNFETAPCMQPDADFYRGRGFAVLVPEFPGYGDSTGTPGSQDALTGGIARWVGDTLARPELKDVKTVFHGRSMGGLVAAQVALRQAPDALVLESSGHSVSELSWRFYAPPFLVRFPFRTGDALKQGDYPVFIAHGTADDIFPVSHAKANAQDAGARATLVLVENGTHNTMKFPRQALENFLDQALPR